MCKVKRAFYAQSVTSMGWPKMPFASWTTIIDRGFKRDPGPAHRPSIWTTSFRNIWNCISTHSNPSLHEQFKNRRPNRHDQSWHEMDGHHSQHHPYVAASITRSVVCRLDRAGGHARVWFCHLCRVGTILLFNMPSVLEFFRLKGLASSAVEKIGLEVIQLSPEGLELRLDYGKRQGRPFRFSLDKVGAAHVPEPNLGHSWSRWNNNFGSLEGIASMSPSKERHMSSASNSNTETPSTWPKPSISDSQSFKSNELRDCLLAGGIEGNQCKCTNHQYRK